MILNTIKSLNCFFSVNNFAVWLFLGQLMKLERKFGDTRFKLDERFAESESEEEDSNGKSSSIIK